MWALLTASSCHELHPCGAASSLKAVEGKKDHTCGEMIESRETQVVDRSWENQLGGAVLRAGNEGASKEKGEKGV